MEQDKMSYGRLWQLLKNSLEGSFWLWGLFLAMLGVSALSVSSGASEVYKANSMLPVFKHIVFLIISFFACWFTSQFPSSFYRKKGLAIFTGATIILNFLLIVNPHVVNGAARWVSFGLFTVQPSDVFKICLILWGAFVGSISYDSEQEKRLYFNLFWGISLLGIVFFLFKNASTGVLLGAFLVVYSLILKMPFALWRKWTLSVALAGTIFAGVIAVIPNDTLKKLPLIHRGTVWKTRVADMFREDKREDKGKNDNKDKKFDILENNYQEKLGLAALARGGWTGVGYGNSQTRDFLPMAYTDYVLAIMVEEWGILAYFILIGFYVAWFALAGVMAQRERNRYRKFLILGIGLLFPMQALINVAVASGLFVTGQPLPLISWGGTSLIISSVAMGILISISRTQMEIERLERQADVLEGQTNEDTTQH